LAYSRTHFTEARPLFRPAGIRLMDVASGLRTIARVNQLQRGHQVPMRSLVAAIVSVVGAMVMAAAPAPGPEAQQSTFRAGVDLIQIDVAVLDGKRRPVRGLTAENFTLLEDGKPQSIVAFTEVDVPRRAANPAVVWLRDAAPDVTSNQVPEEGRLVIILMDRTIPVGAPSITAKHIAAAAVDQLGPGDLAAVVTTGGGAAQNLTSDRTRLLRAINRLEGSTGTAPEEREIGESLAGSIDMQWPFTALNDGRCLCGVCVLDTITRLATAVREIPRRRKILLFIGSDLTLQSPEIACNVRLRDSRERMLQALDRASLTVHSLDPAGLGIVSPMAQASSTLRGVAVPQAYTRAVRENLEKQDTLSVLPDRTGGRTVVNANDPDLAVSEIVRESGSYYLLGFRRADPSGDGQFHKISVKVNRRGLDVHTSRGYLAPVAAAPPAEAAAAGGDELQAILSGLLPKGGIPLEVNAAVFAVPGTARPTVALILGIQPFVTATGAIERPDRVEVLYSAFDRSGHPKGSARQTLDVPWPAAVEDAGAMREGLPFVESAASRVDVLSRIDLDAGEYEIRVGVAAGTPVRTASVFTYVDVPPFYANPLSLSSLVLGVTPASTVVPADFLARLLPVVPTARREFSRSDRLAAFLRVYQGTSRRDPLAAVLIRARVIDAKNQTVAADSATLPEAQFADGRAAGYQLDLPLERMEPGEYLLSVNAAIGARSAGRAVRFRVR
jgi:VWFA-related protein